MLRVVLLVVIVVVVGVGSRGPLFISHVQFLEVCSKVARLFSLLQR